MAISVTIRPDRVTATGVIAPYPIEQRNPVAIARQTINPFVQGIRSTGPQLSGPNQIATVVAAPRMHGVWAKIRAALKMAKGW